MTGRGGNVQRGRENPPRDRRNTINTKVKKLNNICNYYYSN